MPRKRSSKFDNKNFTKLIRLFFILQTDEGNVLFEDKIESDPISLIYGPIFDVVSHIDYVYVNESIILPISFLAKPMPNIEGISWQVFSGDIIQIMQPGDVSYINYEISYLTAEYVVFSTAISFTVKVLNQG